MEISTGCCLTNSEVEYKLRIFLRLQKITIRRKIILSSDCIFQLKKITLWANPMQIKKGFKAYRLKPFSVLWAHQDLNLGPSDYESDALTN